MQLGIYLHELWERKVGLAIAVVLAILVAARIGFGATFLPPRIDANSVELASASTHVLVDTPQSSVIDLRQNTYNLSELSNRALLLGNVMASLPVRDYIAREAGIPANLIRVSPPLTPEQPRAIADSAHQPKSSDILKSPDEYRLSVQANPTVPVVDIYTEAPNGAAAVNLADSSVRGLRDYLAVLAQRNGTPTANQVKLVQLGGAEGGTVNPGGGIQIAIVAFLLVFAASCVGVLALARIRRGWAESGEPAAPPSIGDPT